MQTRMQTVIVNARTKTCSVFLVRVEWCKLYLVLTARHLRKENAAVRAIGEADEFSRLGTSNELTLVRSDEFRCSLRDGVESCLRVGGRDVWLFYI